MAGFHSFAKIRLRMPIYMVQVRSGLGDKDRTNFSLHMLLPLLSFLGLLKDVGRYNKGLAPSMWAFPL